MVKEENEKSCFKLNIEKIKIIGHISSWQIEGGKWKQCQILFFWVPKSLWTVTVTIKLNTHTHNLPHGRKSMTILDSSFKSRYIT